MKAFYYKFLFYVNALIRLRIRCTPAWGNLTGDIWAGPGELSMSAGPRHHWEDPWTVFVWPIWPGWFPRMTRWVKAFCTQPVRLVRCPGFVVVQVNGIGKVMAYTHFSKGYGASERKLWRYCIVSAGPSSPDPCVYAFGPGANSKAWLSPRRVFSVGCSC